MLDLVYSPEKGLKKTLQRDGKVFTPDDTGFKFKGVSVKEAHALITSGFCKPLDKKSYLEAAKEEKLVKEEPKKEEPKKEEPKKEEDPKKTGKK